MTLPSESAIDKVERAFPAIWTRTGCEDWLKGLYAIDVQPLLARIEELRTENGRYSAFLNFEGYRRCDIPACNCGSWHGGDAERRLSEVCEERNRLSALAGKLIADLYGMQDGCLVRDLQAANDRLKEELADKTQLLEDLKAGKLENENRRLSKELAEARKVIHQAYCISDSRSPVYSVRGAEELLSEIHKIISTAKELE